MTGTKVAPVAVARNVKKIKFNALGAIQDRKIPLKCHFHWLAYRIECKRRADEVDSVIHPEMGRGHSNLCEASVIVLPQFRSKSESLCRYDCMLQLL